MSLSALLLETLFTRIFSVTFWSQFAFMAVSVAMLGLTVGALLVYLLPRFRDPKRISRQLAGSSLLFAATIPLTLVLHLLIPTHEVGGVKGIFFLTAEFLSLTLPFLFSGINVTLVLMHYQKDFRKLYAADLFGAALGCILFIGAVQVMNELQALVGVVVLGVGAAWTYQEEEKTGRKWMGILLLGLLGFWASDLIGGWLDASWLQSPSGSPDVNLVGAAQFSERSLEVLHSLLGVTLGILVLFLPGPYLLRSAQRPRGRDIMLLGYFTLIGIGFMLIEISQLQYLNVFLGNPDYSISMVLCTLLLATGLGSYLARRDQRRTGIRRLLGLLLVLVVTGLATGEMVEWGREADIQLGGRLLVAAAILLPMGVAMGMAMPLGMDLARRERPDLAPWFWSVNGAASVAASVMAVVLAVDFSLEVPYWTGAVGYGLAVACYVLMVRNQPE